MRTLTAALVLLAVITLPSRAHAYSYDEHCRVSSLAFALARQRLERESPSDAMLRRRTLPSWVASLGAACTKRSGHTYGDLVARVDFGTAPGDFYLGAGPMADYPGLFRDDIPWQQIDLLAANPQQNWKAARLNVDHFQDRALFSAWDYHQQAVLTAAGGHLARALIAAAFADHFGQDITAPGHVRTPRRDFHDVPSLGIHDHYNEKGVAYRFRDLSVLAAFLVDSIDGSLKARLQKIGLGDPASLRERIASSSGASVVFYGDELLAEQPMQELFLVLTTAQSVYDVLRSYAGAEASNAFEHPQWRNYMFVRRGPEQGRHAPLARSTFGEFPAVTEGGAIPFSGVYSLSFGPLVVANGEGAAGRVRVTADALVLGSPGGTWLVNENGQPIRLPYFGLLLGGDWTFAQSGGGPGANLRLVLPSRKLDIQTSVTSAVRWSRRGEGGLSGYYVPGVRLETGFGLFFIGLSAELERSYDANGDRKPALGLSSSMTLAVPGKYLSPW
jgi:hypothetical protein